MTSVLLIEDDILLADCYRRWLAADGFLVHHAVTAQDALDVIDDTNPDIIMLDMLLPGANGMQILHTLRSHADLTNKPVIICSNAISGDESALQAYGARAVLDKTTLTRDKLCQAIKEVL